jgi:hypothetical protein
MLQDTMHQASGLLLEMQSVHTVICTVIRYVALSKIMCELLYIVNIKFQGDEIIYPNDWLHLLYKEIIFILGMKLLPVTDICGSRAQFQIKSPSWSSIHDAIHSTDNLQ